MNTNVFLRINIGQWAAGQTFRLDWFILFLQLVVLTVVVLALLSSVLAQVLLWHGHWCSNQVCPRAWLPESIMPGYVVYNTYTCSHLAVLECVNAVYTAYMALYLLLLPNVPSLLECWLCCCRSLEVFLVSVISQEFVLLAIYRTCPSLHCTVAIASARLSIGLRMGSCPCNGVNITSDGLVVWVLIPLKILYDTTAVSSIISTIRPHESYIVIKLSMCIVLSYIVTGIFINATRPWSPRNLNRTLEWRLL